MRNELTISNGVVTHCSCTNDTTNTLYINGTQQSESAWVGEGSFTYGGVTIDKVAKTDYNVQAIRVEDNHYKLVGKYSIEVRVTKNEQEIAQEVYDRSTADSGLSSRIAQSAHTIALSVNNQYSTAGITITLKDENGNTINTGTGTINMNGMVTFTNNSYCTQSYAQTQASNARTNAVSDVNTSLSNGSTTIDGGCITTGDIYAHNSNYTYWVKIQTTSGLLSWDMEKSSMDSNGNITIKGLNGAYLNFNSSNLNVSRNSSATIRAIYFDDGFTAEDTRSGISAKNKYIKLRMDDGLDMRYYPTTSTYKKLTLNNNVLDVYYSSTGVYTLFTLSGEGATALEFGHDNNSTNNYYVKSNVVYNRTSSSASNVYIGSTGVLVRSTSSARYKNHITYLEDSDMINAEVIEDARALKPCLFRYNEGHITDTNDGKPYNDARYEIGLIAEDVEEAIGDYAAIYAMDDNDDLVVENWSDRAVITMVVSLAQDNANRLDEKDKIIEKQQKEIDDLKERLARLEARLA